MNYFEAKTAKTEVEQFRDLVLGYWISEKQGNAPQGTTTTSSSSPKELREAIQNKLIHVQRISNGLGVGKMLQVQPPRILGGLVYNIDFWDLVVDGEAPYGSGVSFQEVKDFLDQIVGAARKEEQAALQRLKNPVNWIAWPFAQIIRFPFIVLRLSGLPPSIEDHIASQLVKIASLVILLGLLASMGLLKYFEYAASVLH